MRIYTASDEENLRTLRLLKDWATEGFLSESQYLTMKLDVACGLRRTNFFLRLVFFLFTLIAVSAAVGLFMLASIDGPALGVFALFCAVLCYGGAEALVSYKHLYRHGVEEALVALSVLLLSFGLELALFSHAQASSAQSLVPAAAAIASILIWLRFGFVYAFLAAMLCVAGLPYSWTSSHTAQHLIVAGFYAGGLIAIAIARHPARFDFRDDEYSLAEALLWLGIYVTCNLQLSSIDELRRWWNPAASAPDGFPRLFYWTTYALIWCLPVAMLWRALKKKDRAITVLGLIAAILTLVTNKPYLGLPRHSWDPMLLGVVLTASAIAVRRWLASGPGNSRRGFTAERLLARDKTAKDLLATFGGTLAGTTAAQTPSPAAQPSFGGGDSGGGGATSDF